MVTGLGGTPPGPKNGFGDLFRFFGLSRHPWICFCWVDFSMGGCFLQGFKREGSLKGEWCGSVRAEAVGPGKGEYSKVEEVYPSVPGAKELLAYRVPRPCKSFFLWALTKGLHEAVTQCIKKKQ